MSITLVTLFQIISMHLTFHFYEKIIEFILVIITRKNTTLYIDLFILRKPAPLTFIMAHSHTHTLSHGTYFRFPPWAHMCINFEWIYFNFPVCYLADHGISIVQPPHVTFYSAPSSHYFFYIAKTVISC